MTPGGVPGHLDSCPFPLSVGTYEERSFCSECVCDELCVGVANMTVNASNNALNITSEQGELFSLFPLY